MKTQSGKSNVCTAGTNRSVNKLYSHSFAITLEKEIGYKRTAGKLMRGIGNSFFSLPKCKVVFVRWYLTCKVVPYKKY